MSIMEAQRRTRAGFVDEQTREAGAWAILKAERASVAARRRQAENEAGPGTCDPRRNFANPYFVRPESAAIRKEARTQPMIFCS
jgi:hypothetical protein